MALCRVMQLDFEHGWGRYDECGQQRYSDADLDYGAAYAADYLAAGITREPLYFFDLEAFKAWCEKQPRNGMSDHDPSPTYRRRRKR